MYISTPSIKQNHENQINSNPHRKTKIDSLLETFPKSRGLVLARHMNEEKVSRTAQWKYQNQ